MKSLFKNLFVFFAATVVINGTTIVTTTVTSTSSSGSKLEFNQTPTLDNNQTTTKIITTV